MAITYHNSASTPADNGTNTATTTAVTPPASMVTGDLVVMYAYRRSASATMDISETGGQTWTSSVLHNGTTAVLSCRVFFCRYNGTWSANPSVIFDAGVNTNVVMHVFRPTSSSYHWAIDNCSSDAIPAFFSFAAQSPVAILDWNGVSADNASTVSIASWMTDDDNTWGSLTAGWTVTGTAQYRNTSGSDVSSSYAHKILTTITNINTVQKTQATLGNDPGIWGAFTFYEYIPAIETGLLPFCISPQPTR